MNEKDQEILQSLKQALARKALWEATELTEEDFLEAEAMPSEEEIAAFHTFSPEFEARMQALFAAERERNAKRLEEGLPVLVPPKDENDVVHWVEAPIEARKKRKKKNRALRNGLLAAACLLVFIGVGAVQSIQSGAVFGIEMETFREFYDQFVSVTWGSNEKEAKKVVVLEPGPEVLPEGVVESNRVVTDSRYRIVYEKDGQYVLFISGSTIDAGIEMLNDDASLIEDNLLISGTSCDVFQLPKEDYLIVWEEENFVYTVTAMTTYEHAITIVENMLLKTNKMKSSGICNRDIIIPSQKPSSFV